LTGYSHDEDRWGGTYNASWTWFEAGVKKPDGRSLPRRPIQRNVHAEWEYREHVNVWDYHQTPDPSLRGWLSIIEGGDVIQVFPKARFDGWVNYVREAEIHLWSDSIIQEQPISPDLLLTEQTANSEMEICPPE
jgi:hypothetical protein